MSVIAVSATFTAQPFGETLNFWLRRLAWDWEIRFAPYNQVFQELLSPSSLLASNTDGADVVLVRLEDFGADPESGAHELASALGQARDSFRVPILVAVCPASPVALAEPGRAAALDRAAQIIQGAADPFLLITPEDLDRLYPVREYYDSHADRLGHLPFTPEFFAALGTLAARKLRALRAAPYKVIVLDCDETLWKGICGEDGPEEVELDAPRRALQEFMRARRDSGMLLALASKNNEADVLETFRLHPEMPLRLEDFACRRINWGSKADSLVSIAQELRLGLDSFIFVDDSPAQCAEVEAGCPEVLSLALPADPADIPRFLDHVWAFDQPRATEEDRRRAGLYAEESARANLEKQSANIEEFIAALNLEVGIGPATREQFPRIAQLTQRTNQMNLTLVRRSEDEIRTLLDSGGAECLTVHVSDRFGSYGLVGVMIFKVSDALGVDTFLLSCRALGRGVGHRMLAELGRAAMARGIGRVEIPFVTGPRNSPARDLLDGIGRPDGDGTYRFEAGQLAQVRYRPAGVRPPAPTPRTAEPARIPFNYARVAREFHDARQVLAGVMAARQSAAPGRTPLAPRTSLERRLAGIWSEMLGVADCGVEDNFFDLGGHSLLAVQLLSRVRKEFGVDLSLDVVYGGPFTIAELARAIDVSQIEQAGSDEYAALLQELEGMTDEEVRALLEREGG
jgi:FkbH-like protein